MEEHGLEQVLGANGFIVHYYEQFETNPWFVGLGSHGGDGDTLRVAAHKCLKCCKIGKWWRLDSGELAKDFVARLFP